jgi:hypothetical protein
MSSISKTWTLTTSIQLLPLRTPTLTIPRVFRTGTKFDKDRNFYSHPTTEGAHLNMTSLPPAKARKDTMAPYFSRVAVSRLEPLIQDKISKFIILLLNAGYRNKVVDLSLGYRCLTIDVITHYCFQKSHDAMDAPGFEDPFVGALMVLTRNGRHDKYIPYIGAMVFCSMMALPKGLVNGISPQLGSVRKYHDASRLISLLNLLYTDHF